MKKIITTLMLFSIVVLSYAQTSTSTIKWDIFASSLFDAETFEPINVRQNFIKVRQEHNCYYWGDENYYMLYNKAENHSGFITITTYDFIDKYHQRGRFMYMYDRSADWATKHMFWILYEGQDRGMVYFSNEPKIEKK